MITRNKVTIWWNGKVCLDGNMSATLAHANIRHMAANFNSHEVPHVPFLVDIANALPGQVFEWEYGDETGYARVLVEVQH